MRIESSTVVLQANHRQTREYTRTETLKTWHGGRKTGPKPFDQSAVHALKFPAPQRGINFKAFLAEINSSRVNTAAAVRENVENDPRYRLLEILIKMLFGDDAEVNDIVRNTRLPGIRCCRGEPGGSRDAPETKMEYVVEERYTDRENVRLEAHGQVLTADGRELAFNMDLLLDRQYVDTVRSRFLDGNLVESDASTSSSNYNGTFRVTDPLVINFSGTAAELSDTTFAFDLDADGSTEDIAALKQGSGYLAFDRNADGVINDGSELFGPGTGNGFTELAAHDSDGNLWLDENDAAYADLSVWRKDSAGNDELLSLQDADVGAVFLGNVSAPFTYTDANNESLAVSRRAGIYLHEDGRAGSVQQIDYYT